MKIIKNGTSKIREVLSEDGSPYLSAGRVGMFTCLLFSILVTLLGLRYLNNEKILNYCSLIALQFLGTSVIFYGATKTSETFRVNSFSSNLMNKMPETVTKLINTSLLATTAQSPATKPPVKEKPEFEDIL